MVTFWKCTAGLLIAVVLILTVGKQEKDLALILSMAVCVMTVIVAATFFEPVVDFLFRLESLGNLKTGALKSLLKITGTALVSEITGMILADGGNAALAKGMQILGTAVILSLSIPIFEELLNLLQYVLGEL